MGLAKAQQILITKARNPGGSELGVFLDDATCAYLTAVIISDLGVTQHFPEIPVSISSFFGSQKLNELRINDLNFLPLLERLFTIYNDAEYPLHNGWSCGNGAG